MATSTGNSVSFRANYPLATEFGFVIAASVCLSLVEYAVSAGTSQVLDALALRGGLLVDGLFVGGAVVAGSALVVGAYATRRDIEVGLALPARGDLPSVALALAVPAALVGLTKLVGVLTGTTYGSLAKVAYASDAAVWPVAAVTGLGLLVGVPSYLLLCQVVVQGSFERVLDGRTAVLLTTVTTGFLLAGSAGGGLSPFPDRGKLVGAVAFGLAVGVALYGNERADRRWVRYVASLPAALFVALVAASGVVAVQSVAGLLFGATQVLVLGLAAHTYERTGSLAVPALAYVSLALTGDAVVFVFEAGARGL